MRDNMKTLRLVLTDGADKEIPCEGCYFEEACKHTDRMTLDILSCEDHPGYNWQQEIINE